MREVFDLTVPWAGDVSIEEVSCLLCGQRDFVPLNTFVLNGRRFYTVRCLADGMMWLDPRPGGDFYRRLYTERYHQAGPDDPLFEQAVLDVHSDEAALRAVAALRLDEIDRFTAPGRLLEVGFGAGHVLLGARSRGWDVFGLDLAPSCVEAARAQGLPAARAALPDYGGQGESFDVVAMYSVIEHTPDPRAYLRRAWELLRPGGLLVLRLPDTPAEGPLTSLIAHRYHFNQLTIAALLNRCGFDVLRIGSFGLWQATKYPCTVTSMNVVSRKGDLD